ncbi:hypothetical protein K5E_26870 [Enterococcus thailandicus]|uniref:Uncharacterized protein n=1 Tax=Enterococcus gallinarum TaxID=1353 RepID=A0A8E8PJ97_ENTGA|nr:hypothetical protein [Enterococcus gallinarum]UJJ80308.1 Hypothetical protein [Enterococcus faecalis]GMC02476.1 hypothetical protein K2F_27380 [Enterococcus thailandicus]GMC10547.1 hypothetical protein K5E_26870 [Enterococcus thailandicus]
MGIDFINVEFRKHVKVSGDLGTTGSVCPFFCLISSVSLENRIFNHAVEIW